jgi:glycosyltransferase involved in cell wall biosynthesis
LKIAWLSYLDPFVMSGGGEMDNRTLIEVGRRRGHTVTVSAWLRQRSQRLLRRAGMLRGVGVNWSADAFVVSNIRNVASRPDRFPEEVVLRALGTGRALVMADAWVDVCPLDLPCDGQTSRCPRGCSRAWGDRLFGGASAVSFVSPMQHRLTEQVLDVALPDRVIYSRPAIDTRRFRPLDLERDIDVLYVGSINEAKGYSNLLERFGPERLTFVGRNGLGHPVAGNYLGVIPNDRLPTTYNRARIFAHLPQWNEPMGRSVVEAALCGCELVLNERVGVASYPPDVWRNPEHVALNADRFWDEFGQHFG